jgi:transporter family-2 protein
MTLLPAILIAALIGTMLPLQGLVNARLGTNIGGPVAAAFVSFLVGTVLLGLYLLAARTSLMPRPGARFPVWIWAGGALGAIYVACFTLLVPRLGTAAIICLAVFGQIVASLLLDHFGVLQAPRAADLTRVIGAALVLVGVTLVVAPWRAAPAVDAARSDVHPSTTQSNGTTG